MAKRIDTEAAGGTAKLPYIVQPTMLPRILTKIKEAKAPDRFTQDFLQTKLGFKGGNNRQFIPLAKKLGLLESDGSPTDLYKKFRNPSTSGAAIAQAIKHGYRELFERNEFAYGLKKDELKGLVVEITGLESRSQVVQRICQTFEALNKIADFEASSTQQSGDDEAGRATENDQTPPSHEAEIKGIKMGLAYTINLVLPKTDDPAVFNAIFRSLRANLLRH